MIDSKDKVITKEKDKIIFFEFGNEQNDLSKNENNDIDNEHHEIDYNIEDVQGTYYCIYCYDFDRREALGGFIGELLDMDVRGH